MNHIKIYLDINRQDEDRPTFEAIGSSVKECIDHAVGHFGVEGIFNLFTMDGHLVIQKNCSPVFICESDGTQAEDVLQMKKYYNEKLI